MKPPLLPFQHDKILQTAMPMGGLGAGSICLNGSGGLQDFAIHNRPHLTAHGLDSHACSTAAFALLRIKGEVSRLVEGPLPIEKIYDQGLQGTGYRQGGHEGLPRFKTSRFESGYPFGCVKLTDPEVPVSVEILGWSPLIPLDDVGSGIPCAILEYKVRNTSKREVDFAFTWALSHPAVGKSGKDRGTRNEVIPGKGVHFYNTEEKSDATFGGAGLTVIGERPKIQAMWMRGGWFDAISALWRDCEDERFPTNRGSEGTAYDGRNGGAVQVEGHLAPGKEKTIRVLLTWYFPNSDVVAGRATPEPVGTWKVFYASIWRDAADVAKYVHRNFDSLRERTAGFQRLLCESSLPREALDAVLANLAILKSPTILRQANGNLWGWEGTFQTCGSCHGSCTHVWNYAQTICHLFPAVERTLREAEYRRSMDEHGHVNFRSALPDGPVKHDYHAAADGQLGGIMKVYRDWHISGDGKWMRGLYPLARRSLEYCIRKWDPDNRGALFEPHHNTYDIEFWGPDGMCTSIYLGALSAMGEMAEALGKNKDAARYRELARRGAEFMEKELFNGEYFFQRVQYRNLHDKSFVELLRNPAPGAQTPAMLRLLKKEGPRYQYGTGCLSDGVIGAWMAAIYGIRTPLDRRLVRKTLQAIHRHNFCRNLRTHANCQRPGYAMGEEAGLLLCSWPRGGKPTLPFVYSDEVWTGIEYQVATHLIAEGYVSKGMDIVKATRSRYDGHTRNPWNEYECGNFYARAMASFALVGALSGFRYSAVEKTLWLAPKTRRRPFVTFFPTASAYGSITILADRVTISVTEGRLAIRRLVIERDGGTFDLELDVTVAPGKAKTIRLAQ